MLVEHLRRLLTPLRNKRWPFVLLLLVYNMDLMTGIPAATLEHEVNLRVKSHKLGGGSPIILKLWSRHTSTTYFQTSFM